MIKFAGEQFGDGTYRAHLEMSATQRVEFRAETMAVLLSQMLDAYDAAMGRNVDQMEATTAPTAEAQPWPEVTPRSPVETPEAQPKRAPIPADIRVSSRVTGRVPRK